MHAKYFAHTSNQHTIFYFKLTFRIQSLAAGIQYRDQMLFLQVISRHRKVKYGFATIGFVQRGATGEFAGRAHAVDGETIVFTLVV